MKADYTIFDSIIRTSEWLEDEESRMLLKQRALYSLTGDKRYIYEIVKYSDRLDLNLVEKTYWEIQEKYQIYPQPDVLSFIGSHPGKKVIIFGCGNMGGEMLCLLTHAGITVEAFCDNRQTGCCQGRAVLSPRELIKQYPEALILISSIRYREEIYYQLKGMGIHEENIFYPGENALIAFYGDPYFDKEFFRAEPKEIFVDGGCYGVETTLDFIRWCPDYDKIYAFEPDPRNYERCKAKGEELQIRNLNLYNLGLWSSRQELSFDRGGDDGTGSHISQEGSQLIRTVGLDEILGGKKVTYIKLDIEGAELEALKGAKQTISTFRPKLAVCLYHKPEDIFEIPEYIKKLVPQYHMAIRHYTTYLYDTILYCWI